MTRPSPPLAALAAAFVLALAGCGDDGESSSGTVAAPPPGTTPAATGTGPVASTPAAPPPPTDAAPPSPAEPGGEPAPGGEPPAGGDGGGAQPEEEPVRVPATFALRDGALVPPAITVPPFLAVEVSIASVDGEAHEATVATPSPKRFALPANGRGAVRLPGLRAGEYAIEVDGRRAGTLVVGGEVGP